MTEDPHQPESPYSNVNKAVNQSLTGLDYVRGHGDRGGERFAKVDQNLPEAGYCKNMLNTKNCPTCVLLHTKTPNLRKVFGKY